MKDILKQQDFNHLSFLLQINHYHKVKPILEDPNFMSHDFIVML